MDFDTNVYISIKHWIQKDLQNTKRLETRQRNILNCLDGTERT